MATTQRPRLGVNHPTVVPTNFDAEKERAEAADRDRDRPDEDDEATAADRRA